jgi:hypothetical protein
LAARTRDIGAVGENLCPTLQGATLVALTPESVPAALATWLPNRDSVAYLTGVYLTEGRHGPVQVLARLPIR